MKVDESTEASRPRLRIGNMRVIDAIFKSAQSGKWEPIE
jgi:hypothetical protein